MFDKNQFAQILKNINDTYSSQRDFSKKSEINRTYLSQYMNMKLNEPPKPKILEKLAKSSNGITDYNKLMEICGYIDTFEITKDTYTFIEITDYEWSLIFGNEKNILLTKNESIIWAEITHNLENIEENQDNINTFSYDLNSYLKKCKNVNEENTITKLYYFFMLILTKFVGQKQKYDEEIAELKRMK